MKTPRLLLLLSVISIGTIAQTKNQDFHLDKEYTVTPLGTLTLSASDAKVQIVGSTRKTAHVKIDREVSSKGVTFGEEDFRVDVEDNGGNLTIKEYHRSAHFGVVGYHYEKYTIVIEIPDGMSMRIKGDDGDYMIKNVNGAIDASLDDGDLELIGCKGSDFRFRMDDGDIKMDEGRGTLEVDADDADVFIQKGNFIAISAKMDDGDFVIQTSLTDNGDYSIDAQDGLVSLTILNGGGTFDIRHDDGRVLTEGKFNVVEKSEDYTLVTSAKGKAKVEIRADDARVRLINM